MNTINVTSAPKTATFQMRINPEVKQRMEDIYARQGLSFTDAVNIFIQQSLNMEGLGIRRRRLPHPWGDRMKLRYTPEALRDLQEIKRYIKSEIHNPTAANRITKAILDGCAQLKQFPEMGVSIGAKTGYETDLRMLVVESYIALYRIETEVVSVGRIINARQDYIHILFGEVTPQ